jgi:hypothetical protein
LSWEDGRGFDAETGDVFNMAGSSIVKDSGGGGPVYANVSDALDIGGDAGLRYMEDVRRMEKELSRSLGAATGFGPQGGYGDAFSAQRAGRARDEIVYRHRDKLKQLKESYTGGKGGGSVVRNGGGGSGGIAGRSFFGASRMGAFSKDMEDRLIAQGREQAMLPVMSAARGAGASLAGRGLGANPFAQASMMADAAVAGGMGAGAAERDIRMFEANMGERPAYGPADMQVDMNADLAMRDFLKGNKDFFKTRNKFFADEDNSVFGGYI